MKKLALLLALGTFVGAFLGGCFPEGEGKDELIKESPMMGAAGGELSDQTAPVGPAADAVSDATSSAFPATVQPVVQQLSSQKAPAEDTPIHPEGQTQ